MTEERGYTVQAFRLVRVDPVAELVRENEAMGAYGAPQESENA